MRQLDIPLSIYAATQYDEYRKPWTGMWREFVDDYDLDVDDTRVDLEGSFFVGDAAGRPGDHSCVDRYVFYRYGKGLDLTVTGTLLQMWLSSFTRRRSSFLMLVLSRLYDSLIQRHILTLTLMRLVSIPVLCVLPS